MPTRFGAGGGKRRSRARVGSQPYAGQIEVEVAFLPHALPEGLEAPAIIRAAALQMALAPEAKVRLAAEPKGAFVYPCRDIIICRA